MARQVDFFVFPQFQLLDLSGPLAVFQMAGEAVSGSYQTRVVAEVEGPVMSSAGVTVEAHRLGRRSPDTLIVVGGRGVHTCAAILRMRALIAGVSNRSRRTASVCTGAFLLAAAGLLDGRRATTHWRMADRLQAAHPAVELHPDRIYLKDGAIWTSAGVSAGIDLALALVEEDLGANVAKAVAQEMVVYHRRPAGQSQFSALLDLTSSSDRIAQTLQYARDHLHEKLSVERLAGIACMSARQFARVFFAETRCTPAKAIERLRVDAARPMVEDGRETLDKIAQMTGFREPERMRKAFIRAYGQPPQALRRGAHMQSA
jgi:transcriptional regulator GlxA family with amidase domain